MPARGSTQPRLSVVGLGKLGAPMAALFAAKGFDVVGVDLNPAFVEAVNRGEAPVQEPQLQDFITAGRSRLRATLILDEAVATSDVTFVIVPTPSRSNSFFSNKHVVGAVEGIGAALRSKTERHLVVVTSTVMPGSTGGEIRAALERRSGRELGAELGLCYNPEFVALGSVIHDMRFPDMILIGEAQARDGDALADIYRATTESQPAIHRMNFVNAEICKISLNTFVTTKISYANMLADLCDHLEGGDVDVVTRALGADSRIGAKYLRGAVGYGGPCFPRDNKAFAALARSLGVRSDLAEATDGINDYQLERLLSAVRIGAPGAHRVAILGMSYKPQTSVIEESPGVALAKALIAQSYQVIICDPESVEHAKAVLGPRVEAASTLDGALAEADVAIVMTPWTEFTTAPASAFAGKRGKLVVIDPWRCLNFDEASKFVTIISPGRGDWRFSPETEDVAAAAAVE